MSLKIVELFAGVGGFRIGFEDANKELNKNLFSVIWSNQWEPNETAQHASKVYEARWGSESHSNQDIAKVQTSEIPSADILVGGFPCQDYSVARTLNQSSGIVGKKGVLWWEIHRILEHKLPPLVILENVDRLLGSPASQRGRDFALILASMNDLGYAVEWRIVNAAEYGFPQRRRRTFIVGYRNNTKAFKLINEDLLDWILSKGVIATAFNCLPAVSGAIKSFEIKGDLPTVSETFNQSSPKLSPFSNTGIAVGRQVITLKTIPAYQGKFQTLGQLIIPEKDVPADYFISEHELEKWRFLKGAKSLMRTKKDGTVYSYDEGPVGFPDDLNKPARTIITSEGGKSASRFKHVVITESNKYRRLTPIELERINGFPDNHTFVGKISDARRAFFMGNALVTGVVRELAKAITKIDLI
jgi:DNA (cytosine-5)-methyltransferase 1